MKEPTNDVVIKIEGLRKKFCRDLKRILLYGSLDIIRDMFGVPFDRARLRPKEFLSLDGINLEIRRGETFGLVGANGSGKTTLLRLINGIFPPDAGRITVRGRVGALIAVGAGFHPHMTGRENIYLNGTILGMTRHEIDGQLDRIIAFADIGDFLDAPVSTYSSGMTVRLGFAIAIHGQPDIMLVDEILAVGDVKFQRKCLDKIREMRERGVTFILVTHNMATVHSMCHRALLLDHGQPVMVDEPAAVIAEYEIRLRRGNGGDADEAATSGTGASLPLIFRYPGYGTKDEVAVRRLELRGPEGVAAREHVTGQAAVLALELEVAANLPSAVLYASFIHVEDRRDRDRDLVALGLTESVSLGEGRCIVGLDLGPLPLTTGEYKVSLVISDESRNNPYAQGHYGYFTVKSDKPTGLSAGRGTPLCWVRPGVSVSVAD
jgi:ABC-type polysaccharide/polyol phosphate transport system ATPase subunit